VDPRAIAKALLLEGFPGAATATAPTAGTMSGDSRTIPNNNLDVFADVISTAAIAASAETPGIPIDFIKILIDGEGEDEILARVKI